MSLRRTLCATTSVCTSALCAWRTWRGRCGRWTRWSTRNAGRRRSQGTFCHLSLDPDLKVNHVKRKSKRLNSVLFKTVLRVCYAQYSLPALQCVSIFHIFPAGIDYVRWLVSFLSSYVSRSPSLVKNLPCSLGYGSALNASLQVRTCDSPAACLCDWQAGVLPDWWVTAWAWLRWTIGTLAHIRGSFPLTQVSVISPASCQTHSAPLWSSQEAALLLSPLSFSFQLWQPLQIDSGMCECKGMCINIYLSCHKWFGFIVYAGKVLMAKTF